MSGVTVSLRDVSVRFGRGVHGTEALHEFSGVFKPGKITALVGGDGAGKSTLLKVLAGRIAPTSGTMDRGKLKQRNVGYQPADSGTWRTLSVDENIQFVAGVYGMEKRYLADRSAELLKAAGLTEAHDRLAGKLSGGMRQKLGFLLAALHEPDLLLLDEPTTGVDPGSREDLWNLMVSEAGRGATVVFATTYLDEAERASELFLLDGGRTIVSGPALKVVGAVPGTVWQAPVEAVDAHAVREDDQAWRRADTIYRWDDAVADVPPVHVRAEGRFERADLDVENASVALLMANNAKRYKFDNRDGGEADDGADSSRDSSGEGSGSAGSGSVSVGSVASPASSASPSSPSEPLLTADHVVKRFGSFTALKGVSLDVRPGEIVGLLGGNGAGKTTLMRIILGLEMATEGDCTILGGKPGIETRKRIGYVPQSLGLYPTLSAAENLDFASRVYGFTPNKGERRFAGQLGKQTVGQLPLGAQRMLACMVATAHHPGVLILDEPTSGMDPLSRAELWQVLHDEADRGVGVLVTTHYMSEAVQCDRLVVLASGSVMASGTMNDITAGRESTVIRTSQWQSAFSRLQDAGLPVSLDGTTLRVPDVPREKVIAALGPLADACELSADRISLEEMLTLQH